MSFMAELDTQDGKPGDRIAKVIARAGICSRRDAEKLIAALRKSRGSQAMRRQRKANAAMADDA